MPPHDHRKGLRFGEPLAQARAALILIHGRGSSPEDIAALATRLPDEGVAFLAPAADGGVWYPQRFFAPLDRNEPGLLSALSVIGDLLAEVKTAGISHERVGLIGFSQGACLALETAARSPHRYGFIAGLSGALIGPLETPRSTGDLGGTPLLLGCAERDAHIPVEYVEHSAVVLTKMGASVTKHIFTGSAHTVFPEEITWLKNQVGKLAQLP